MGYSPPGLQRPDMHSPSLHLAPGPRERAGRTLPEEAFTSSVICRERPGRAEGVIDKNVGAELGLPLWTPASALPLEQGTIGPDHRHHRPNRPLFPDGNVSVHGHGAQTE